MKTKIGRLNKRVTFQKKSQVADGRGGWKTEDYTDLVTVFGGLKAKTSYRDSERENERQLQSSMTYILTIRYRSDINASMRAMIDGKPFYLTKPPYDPDNGLMRWLAMECEERST